MPTMSLQSLLKTVDSVRLLNAAKLHEQPLLSKGKKPLNKLKKPFIIAMIGTALEFYDNALYGFMAPLLVPIFLPEVDPMNALILAYFMYPIGILSAPIGAVVIGKIGDKFGRKKALTLSISGMALATFIVGCLPTYAQIGLLAPLLFVFSRFMQCFFAAGEYNGGAIYVMEHVEESLRPIYSGFYCSSAVLGILLASIMSTWVNWLPQGFWRLPYILAFITALVGIIIRKYASESPEFEELSENEINTKPIVRPKVLHQLKRHWKLMVAILAVVGCFKAVYYLPAVFLNVFIPMVTKSMDKGTVMLINTGALAFYLMMLPVGGWLAYKWGMRKSMVMGGVCAALTSIPLFLLLKDSTVMGVICIKIIFAMLCAWFVGPFHAWIHPLFQTRERYTMVSLSYNISSQIGYCTPAIALWLWHQTHVVFAPALPLLFWSACSVFALIYLQVKK